MKYAHIGTDGKVIGWYSTDVHNVESIPAQKIEVSEAQWQIAIDNGHNKVNTDGSTEFFDFRTSEEISEDQKNAISNAIQNLLDTKAQSLRYDNMMSARSYAGYTNQFQTEAQSLAVWGANCWAVAGQIESDVTAGTRAFPTAEQVLLEMPAYA